jgi:hypothetical protein
LRAFGRTVSLAGPEAALGAARQRLPAAYRTAVGPAERSWSVRKSSGRDWAAVAEGDRLSLWSDVVAATEAVLSDLELWIAERARDRVFVHAGCVAVDGRAIVIPGRTMSGKSSLTAALVRAGAAYFSDEYAVLDRHGLVRPYPRPLALRPDDGSSTRPVTAEEMGGMSGRGPARVGLVAFLQYDVAAGWRPESLTRAQTVLRLLDNTVAARTRPRAALAALERATEGVPALVGTRGDADDSAALLLTRLSS